MPSIAPREFAEAAQNLSISALEAASFKNYAESLM
jgi:hypothetical protein